MFRKEQNSATGKSRTKSSDQANRGRWEPGIKALSEWIPEKQGETQGVAAAVSPTLQGQGIEKIISVPDREDDKLGGITSDFASSYKDEAFFCTQDIIKEGGTATRIALTGLFR